MLRMGERNIVLCVWKWHSYLKNFALWWLRILKISEAGYTVRVPFQKLHFSAMLADSIEYLDLDMQNHNGT